MLDDFCFKSKNLYNHANYLVRQEFMKNGKWLCYGDMDKILKADSKFPDYKAMSTAQSAQQILRLLEKNWKSFFALVKDWSKNKDKYPGRPKLPKYANKNGRKILIMTAQNCKLNEEGMIKFPKTFNGFTAKLSTYNRPEFDRLNQIRFLPRQGKIVMEIVYSKVSCYRKIAKRMNGLDDTVRMNYLTDKRNAKIDDYLHKASRKIIDYCRQYHVSKIIIGKNKEWKQNSPLSKRVNQHFVQIPYMRLIQMIQYKAEEIGVEVILVEESYTSGTSFIDHENPCRENYKKSRRIQRGLFQTSDGSLINADVNGSFQIMKKVVPNEEILWDRGCAYQPFKVTVT